MIDFGETYSSPNYLVKSDLGVLTNAGTVTVALTLPDGTPAVPTMNNPATGTYNFDYLSPQAGRIWGAVTATGGVLGALVRKWPVEFDVSPADPGYILSLASARAHLNITGTQDDEELLGWLESTTRIVEDKVGPVVVRTVTDERHDGGGMSLWLRRAPVVSVTTIAPWLTTGTTYPAADVRVSEGGRVELVSGGCFTGGPFAVTYQAGRLVPAPNIRDGAKIILKGLWETQRGASGMPMQQVEDLVAEPGMGLVMWRAEQLLAPDMLAMNLA